METENSRFLHSVKFGGDRSWQFTTPTLTVVDSPAIVSGMVIKLVIWSLFVNN